MIDQSVAVGRVGRPHGLGGAFVVDDASDDPSRFAVGAELLVGDEAARVLESKQARGRPVIRLDRRVDRGALLAVRRETLAPTREGEYYVFQLVGLEVEEEAGPELGQVVDVQAGRANDVLELDSGLYLPMVEECILDVDLARGRVVVAPGYADAG